MGYVTLNAGRDFLDEMNTCTCVCMYHGIVYLIKKMEWNLSFLYSLLQYHLHSVFATRKYFSLCQSTKR